MAQYAPQGNALSDEQEYLQAYEDVLEKYKGRIGSEVAVVLGIRATKKLCDCCLTAE